jgi:hypothetical protein
MDEEILLNESLVEETPQEEIEIEIVDETPEDLKQPAKERIGKRVPEMSSEEEVSLSEKVQKRIARMTYEVNEQKRKAAEADRQRFAAMKLAQSAIAHQNELAQRLNSIQAGFKQEAIDHRVARQQAVRNEIAKAKEAGDTEKESLLIQQMAELAAAKTAVENWNPQQLQQVEVPTVAEPQPEQSEQPEIDEEALAWAQRNAEWLNKVRSSAEAEACMQYAVAEQARLGRKGYDVNSRSCYDKIDEEIRRRFPDVVGAEARPSATSPRVSTVTNASRVNTVAPGKRVIRLSRDEVAVADGLGISHRDYWEMLQKGNQ